MNIYVVLSLSLILLLVFLVLIWILVSAIKTMMDSKESQILRLTIQLKDEQATSKDLLNRLMSKDVQTYLALTASHQSASATSPYRSKSDAAELDQLHELGVF